MLRGDHLSADSDIVRAAEESLQRQSIVSSILAGCVYYHRDQSKEALLLIYA